MGSGFRFIRLACAVGSACLALPLLNNPVLGETYTVDPNKTIRIPGANDPSNVSGNATSSDPSTFGGMDIGAFLGTNRFYSNGITGQNTITYNIEAGHIWNGHEALGHVTTFTTGTGATGEFDRHATWVGLFIGGRNTVVGSGPFQTGMAPQTDLRSGAIATNWNGTAYATGFNISLASLFTPYNTAFGTADVINSSWGGTGPTGNDIIAVGLDGYARANPRTTFVVSAGNSGPAINTVGTPGSGSNSITVGALGPSNSYNAVSGFSSRGPQDYADPVNGTITGVRAAVDISAPGENLTSAFYGGQTGGNGPTLPGSSNGGTGSNLYSGGIAGTSFASPIVAGCVALLDSAARTNVLLSANANARDARIVKAVLMNSADKTSGWSNGQAVVSGVIKTTQSLDWNVGAGRVNMSRAYDQFLSGTADVPGTAGGTVQNIGWDFGSLSITGTSNSYVIATPLTAGSTFNVTLDWFRDRSFDISTFDDNDNAFRNLDLEVWNSTFTTLIATSNSTYNDVEHLSFLVPANGLYGMRVTYTGNVFGATGTENYGLAWSVPEPTSLGVIALAAAGLLCRRRRSRVAAI